MTAGGCIADLGWRRRGKFLQRGLDSRVARQPVGQITLRRSSLVRKALAGGAISGLSRDRLSANVRGQREDQKQSNGKYRRIGIAGIAGPIAHVPQMQAGLLPDLSYGRLRGRMSHGRARSSFGLRYQMLPSPYECNLERCPAL